MEETEREKERPKKSLLLSMCVARKTRKRAAQKYTWGYLSSGRLGTCLMGMREREREGAREKPKQMLGERGRNEKKRDARAVREKSSDLAPIRFRVLIYAIFRRGRELM